MTDRAQYVVATPTRSVCDDNARALQESGNLRLHALGTRRGAKNISVGRTRLLPAFGLAAYIAAKAIPPFQAETFRFWMLPAFDQWVKRQLNPGDHIISSFGYANASFRKVQQNGGKTLIDAGNSHPDHYWKIVEDEYHRWGCQLPPFPQCWYRRSKEMMPLVDYVLSPSAYVTGSFLQQGFREDQILRNVYPVDLSCFSPSGKDRPSARPFTIISTAGPSLRKGSPYLFEAFRLVLKEVSNAQLIVTDSIHPSIEPLMNKWADLPISWVKPVPHPTLAERLRSADIFVIPSLEEGLVRTAIEAMACGLPVILTPHCGANDFVTENENGSVVPIRSPEAIAEKLLFWWAKIQVGENVESGMLRKQLAYETFAEEFLTQLGDKNLL